MFIYFWERDRVQTGEGQKEKGAQNLKLVLGSELSAQSPMWGLKSQTVEIMTWATTWAKVGCLTHWTTQVPLDKQF